MLEQVTETKVNAILYLIFDNYDELMCCGKNSADLDQLASSESTLFSIEFMSGFILFLKNLYNHVYCFSTLRAKLSSLCIICSLGQVKLSLDKYLTTIYLSLGKYQLLLFHCPCLVAYGDIHLNKRPKWARITHPDEPDHYMLCSTMEATLAIKSDS